MVNLEGARVGFVHQAVKTHFHVELAKSLKSKFGVISCFFVLNKNSIPHLKSLADGAIDEFEIISNDEKCIPTSELIQKANYFEERYNIPIGWCKVTDRVNGLGFSPGGFFHPRSKNSEGVTDEQVLSGYIQTFEYWENIYQTKNLSLLINGGFFEYFPSVAHGVPFRTAFSARNENFYFWTHDCYGQIPDIEAIFLAQDELPSVISEIQTPILSSKQLALLSKHSSSITLLKKLWRVIIKWAYRQYKRDKHKTYKLWSEIGYFLREWWRLKLFDRANLPTLTDLRDKRFVLYALQVEPEIYFQGLSPENFFQLSTIIALSRDLPAGVALVVKEHIPAISRRPSQFYDQIRLLNNVIFVDPRSKGVDLVKASSAVATINGTVGQEAALLGKPVLSFGRRNLYNILPHVKLVNGDADLAQALRWALSFSDQTKARVDGAKYLHCLRKLSFDMQDFGYHNPIGFNDQAIEEAITKLQESLA